jgi:L-alanine-DL-glutamate epimerase-like enolase superfamily enzyme
MVLEGFRTHHLSIPLEREMVNGSFGFARLEHVLLELDAGGAVGIGHAFAFERRQAESIRAMAIDLAESQVGEPIDDPAAVWDALWSRTTYIGHAGPPVMALSMVDSALWDLAGKRLGEPVWRLLGGSGAPLPAYATGGWMSYSVDDLIAEARDLAGRGFGAYKMKVGHRDWRVDLERVAALLDAVDVEVMVDANQGWSVDEAIAAGRELASLGVTWLEEPVAAEDVAGTAQVAAALDLRVAAGESLFTRHGLGPLIDGGAVDVLMPDVMRCGGPSEFMRVARLAEEAGIPVSPHAFPELSAHAMSAGGGLMEYIPGWTEPLFEGEPVVADGVVRPTEAPGLGLSFDRQTIERWQVEGERVAG